MGFPVDTDPQPLHDTEPATRVSRDLDGARRGYYEDPEGSLRVAVHCRELARTLGDAALLTRSLTIQSLVALHRGDLRGAFALAGEAERHAEAGCDERVALAELSALKGQLSFFSGSYAEALEHADRAVELSDAADDLSLRIFTRRAGCLAFGNLHVRDWPARLDELLRLTMIAGDGWEEGLSRNDLAHLHMVEGRVELAADVIERGIELVEADGAPNHFALGVLHCTRADIRLHAGRAADAVADAEHAIDLLSASGEANPYVLAMTVLVQVQSLLALGRLDDAERSGHRAMSGLGDHVPQARSMILGTVAEALRAAGRPEEAYDALARSADLERRAFEEFSELRLGLERATLETRAARQEADALVAKNRELESVVRELAEAHAELERRTMQLEGLQGKLREQADRDWLTGLHNRRYLARELARLAAESASGPLSVAVLDLDRFKQINDRFGHETGDRVLVRVAALLVAELRGADVIVRTGGEEFVVVMPDTEAPAAAACCERLRLAINREPWDRIEPGLSLTTSIGLASGDEAGELDALNRLADRRLYEAKRAGRDRVV
jgi:diguanylate cyclase (GGDEF)-like protein